MATNTQRRERFMSPKAVADALDLHVSAVYRAVRLGDLPAVRLSERGAIRIPRSAIEAEPRP